MLAPGLFGAARRMGSSLFTSISPATCTAAPGGIVSGLFAGRAGAEIGMGLTGAGPLMLVRGMAKKGGRVQDRRVRMSLSPYDHTIHTHPSIHHHTSNTSHQPT